MDGRLDWVATSRDSPERASLLGSLAAASCQSLAPLLERTFGACENVFLELANNASSTYDEQRLPQLDLSATTWNWRPRGLETPLPRGLYFARFRGAGWGASVRVVL